MKKLISILLLLLICIGLFGCDASNNMSDTEAIPNSQPTETSIDTELETEVQTTEIEDTTEFKSEEISATTLIMWRYSWDGYGVSRKDIGSGDLRDNIIECIINLKETGETIPKISDDIIAMDDIYLGEIPTERGTVWIDCGKAGLFRLDPSMSEICKVEKHLGEGIALEMTDTLQGLLRQAWYYYPYDYWDGSYENGEVTLDRICESESLIEWVEIDSIYIENVDQTETNIIVFKIKSNENKTVSYYFESYQSSDNLGSIKVDNIELVKDEEITLEISFAGFVNTRYWISLVIDNTSINLTIN